MSDSPIAEVTIPQYITKVKLSDSRRATYFSKYDSKGVSRTYTYDDLSGKYEPLQDWDLAERENGEWVLPLPKTKALKLVEGDYGWQEGYLVDADGERIVANPQSAGSPNYETLSGNKFSTGFGSPHIRAKLVHGLKDFYRPIVQEQLTPFDDRDFPLRVEWFCYTTVDRSKFDLSNFWFYYKYFEDTLHEEEDPKGNPIDQMIPDDNIEYVTQPPSPILIPIDNWENRKFVFRFFQDQRPVITNHPLWNGQTSR